MAARARTTHTPDGTYAFVLSEDGLLGSGAHGVVRAARNIKTGDFVAVKIMPARALGAVAKELITQAKMHHPSIVQLYSTQVDLDQRRVFMIMGACPRALPPAPCYPPSCASTNAPTLALLAELCRGGELFDRIAECGKLDEATARRYLIQMAQAISYCHEQNVYHRDLKPENILLDEDDAIKIADFGLAALADHTNEDASFLQHTKCGSVMYAAPEVLTSTAQTGYDAAKADMWSLGIIFYSMLSGALPFKVAAATKCERYALVEQRGMRILCEANGFSAEATALLEGMLAPDPAKRASAASVLSSSWVTAGNGPKADAAGAGIGKWSDLLVAGQESVAAAAANGGSTSNGEKRAREEAANGNGNGDAAKAARTSAVATVPAAKDEAGGSVARRGTCPVTGAEEDEEIPDGVNGMLVRSLGWVQLPQEKEKMVGDVASALDSLGVKYEVVKGELSHVVWVGSESDNPQAATEGLETNGQPAPAAAAAVAAANPAPMESGANGGRLPQLDGLPEAAAEPSAYAEGRMCVRIRINPDGESGSALHFDRNAGDVLQFHSFYRDVRNQLAGANGWRESQGRYEFEVSNGQR